MVQKGIELGAKVISCWLPTQPLRHHPQEFGKWEKPGLWIPPIINTSVTCILRRKDPELGNRIPPGQRLDAAGNGLPSSPAAVVDARKLAWKNDHPSEWWLYPGRHLVKDYMILTMLCPKYGEREEVSHHLNFLRKMPNGSRPEQHGRIRDGLVDGKTMVSWASSGYLLNCI